MILWLAPQGLSICLLILSAISLESKFFMKKNSLDWLIKRNTILQMFCGSQPSSYCQYIGMFCAKMANQFGIKTQRTRLCGGASVPVSVLAISQLQNVTKYWECSVPAERCEEGRGGEYTRNQLGALNTPGLSSLKWVSTISVPSELIVNTDMETRRMVIMRWSESVSPSDHSLPHKACHQSLASTTTRPTRTMLSQYLTFHKIHHTYSPATYSN